MRFSRANGSMWVAAGSSGLAVLVVALTACGSGRNYDNPPPEIPVDSTPTTTTALAPTTPAPTISVFVPSTAPTTLPPATVTVAPATYAPAVPPATPAPTSATLTPVNTTGQTYTVVGGDYLSGIANKLGVPLSDLLSVNGLNPSSVIKPGDQLRIPVGGSAPTNPSPTNPPATNPPATNAPVNTTGQRYTVVAGDYLSGIANKLGVPLSELLAANGLTSRSVIEPGDQLVIPAGGSAPTPTPSTPAATSATTAPAATNPAPTSPPVTTAGSSGPTTTFAPPPNGVVPTATSASCQAPNSSEADGTPVVFAPSAVSDFNPATAWRCAAPAAGQAGGTLTFTLAGDTHLTSVGLIGGYVKVDTLTGIDRYTQNYRVRQVRWTFSDGTTVTQDLQDVRTMQTIPVDVATSSVTMQILSTYAPTQNAREFVPVAEVQLLGD